LLLLLLLLLQACCSCWPSCRVSVGCLAAGPAGLGYQRHVQHLACLAQPCWAWPWLGCWEPLLPRLLQPACQAQMP
jgi:hypothetical protein